MPLNARQIEAWYSALQVLRSYSEQTLKGGAWTYRGVARGANSNAIIDVAAYLRGDGPEHLDVARQELRLWGRKATKIADILQKLQAELNGDSTPEQLMASGFDDEITEDEVRSVLTRFRDTGRVPDNWLEASFDWRYVRSLAQFGRKPSIAELGNAPYGTAPARAMLREASG